MDLELLVVPGCPNEKPAVELLHSALTEAGLASQQFRITIIGDDDAAARRKFVGSPTFLIDGADPFISEGQPSGLSCRRYVSSTGGMSGLPDFEEMRQALTAASTA